MLLKKIISPIIIVFSFYTSFGAGLASFSVWCVGPLGHRAIEPVHGISHVASLESDSYGAKVVSTKKGGFNEAIYQLCFDMNIPSEAPFKTMGRTHLSQGQIKNLFLTQNHTPTLRELGIDYGPAIESILQTARPNIHPGVKTTSLLI